jgi:hypothetical protein
LPFDGEAFDKQARYRREVGAGLISQAAVTVEEMSFEIQKMSQVVISGFVRQFMYR